MRQHISFDNQELAVGQLCYQTDVDKEGWHTLIELQILALLGGRMLRVVHNGPAGPREKTVRANTVCVDAERLRRDNLDKLSQYLEQLPKIIERLRNETSIMRTQVIAEATDSIEI